MESVGSFRLLKYFLAAVVLALMGWHSPRFSSLDRVLFDAIQSKRPVTASDKVVVIDLGQDEANVRNYGHFVSRQRLARVLQKIRPADPARVYVDVLLDAPHGSKEDLALKTALGAFDPSRIAIGAIAEKLGFASKFPLTDFSDVSTLVEMSLFADDDGWVRGIDGQTVSAPWLANPARWLAAGLIPSASRTPDRTDASLVRRLDIDRRIAPKSIKVVPADMYLKGSSLKDTFKDTFVDLPDLSGRLVIISTFGQVPGDTVDYPFYGELDRGRLIALGAATLLAASEPPLIHSLLMIAIVVTLVCAAGACVLLVRSRRWIGVGLGAIVTALVGLSIAALYYLGAPLVFFRSVPAVTAGAGVFLAYRLEIADVLSEFLSGDLSPEEAWTWRTYQHHQEAALLVGFDRVKRVNKAAQQLKLINNNNDDRALLSQEINQALEHALREDTKPTVSLQRKGKLRHFRLMRPLTNVPIILFDDITDQRMRETTLQTLVQTDRLTGVANRDGLAAAVADLARRNIPYAIVLLDLNGFKNVNDTYGHLLGDKLIVAVAQRFQSLVRANDTVARLGGDEFAIVLPHMTDLKAAKRITRDLEKGLHDPFVVDAQTINVGGAGGAALSSSRLSLEGVIAVADKRMYARKSYLKRKPIKESQPSSARSVA